MKTQVFPPWMTAGPGGEGVGEDQPACLLTGMNAGSLCPPSITLSPTLPLPFLSPTLI